MFQGLSGPSIAFNEYHVAPAASALGKRDGAADEHRRNKSAAKAERRARVAPKGPEQTPRKPRRERYALRVLRSDVKKAMARGDMATFARLAHKFETLMSRRAQRIEALTPRNNRYT